MRALPPGTILQRLHVRRRLKSMGFYGGSFYEVGSGQGELSNLLLEAGFVGTGFDLNPTACERNAKLNRRWLDSGAYRVRLEDFMNARDLAPADLIVTSMVLEHWPQDRVRSFFDLCPRLLTPRGRLVVLVPGSPDDWGIEDEIAGHLRRYTRESLGHEALAAGLIIHDLRGLTYPLSNLLLRLSNRLVRRSETHKLALSSEEQTIASGSRDVPYKTDFPGWIKLLVNEISLYPFHLAQSAAGKHPRSLVVYGEFGRHN